MDGKADTNAAQEEDHSMAPTVHSLKMFFQNQKQPIIGVKHMSDNHSENTSTSSPSNDSKTLPMDVSDNKSYNRTNRVLPRPPKAIESSDINVPPFHKSALNQSERPVPPIPPVPKPRKSLLKNQSIDHLLEISATQGSNDLNVRSNSLMVSLTKELNELNLKDDKSRAHSLHSLMSSESNTQFMQTLHSRAENLMSGSTEQTSDIEKSDINVTKGSTKGRKVFKSFLKRSKLLSLRKRSAQNSDKKCQTNSLSSVSQLRPIKPTRRPPVPPVLQFRPPAPLPPNEPKEDYYEDTLTPADSPSVTSTCNEPKNGYELYNDSVQFEQIYSTLDNEDQSDDELYEGVDHYDDGLAGDGDLCFADNYYEESNSDFDRIYEVLPFEYDVETDGKSMVSNGSTISLDHYLNEELNKQTISDANTEDNEKSEPKMDSFERKRNLKALKLKKKFNLRGDEIPVNAGVVKEDNRGNRYDLFVRKGETVLILRMEGNPPGKWLAKNERSKVGFVNLDNISFDAESVKSIIKTLTASQSA